jgi:hypothetical protein
MTLDEFNKWWTHFATAFPAAKDHVLKDGKGGKAALALWFEVLCKRTIGDALEVTNRLFEGTLPAIPGTDRGFPDWSQTPRHVSRLCAELRPVEPEWKQHTVRTGGKGIIESDKSMAEAFKRTQEIFAEGGTMDDVNAFLDEYYPGTGKQSPAAARDRGNYEPAFDQFNQG